jgi:hypothetical protein
MTGKLRFPMLGIGNAAGCGHWYVSDSISVA